MNPYMFKLFQQAAGKGGTIGNLANGYLQFKKYKEVATEVTSDVSRMLDKLGGKWIEMQDTAFQTARSMAMSREMAMRYDRQLMQTTKELARQYGITSKEIADFQKSYGEAVGRNIILTKQQIESMAALSKITDNATAAQIIDEFDKIGGGVEFATAKVGLMQERAKALGINATKASKTFASNIKLASSYSFRNGVNDIEKMALKATSLRMEMNAVMSAADKFMNIEDAVTKSANIQLLGGSFAQNFSNPMGAMYEAMADPAAFQERILNTVKGKGLYNEKTGTVEFDPVTMMQMREMANQLGISVDQLTNPAMAKVQDERIQKEMEAAGVWENFSKEERIAIQNLSRNNVDLETGKHKITFIDEDGEEHNKFIEDLTKDELKIAQDRQMSEEGLFKDVQDIKDILNKTLVRARGTTSTKENLTGFKEEVNSFFAQLQNTYMTLVSGGLNGKGFQPWDFIKGGSGGISGGGWDWGTHAPEGIWKNFWGNPNYAFAEGGIVKPIQHAAEGTVVKGDSYSGDKTPIMANAGEMVINQRQQKGLFDLIKNVALTGAMAFGGNRLGKKFGLMGLGTNMAISNLLSGGNLGIGGMLGQGTSMLMASKMGMMSPFGMMPFGMRGLGMRGLTIMNPSITMEGNTVMNGDIGGGSLVDGLESFVDVVGEASDSMEQVTKRTRTFSSRLAEVAKRDTFVGRNARRYLDFRTGRRALGRRTRRGISRAVGRAGDWMKSTKIAKSISNQSNRLKNYRDFIHDRYYDFGAKQFRNKGQFAGKSIGANKFTESILKTKGFFKSVGKDVSTLTGKDVSTLTGKTVKNAKVSKATKALGSTMKGISNVGGVAKGSMKAVTSLGKMAGKLAGPIGAILAVGESVSGMIDAKGQYDEKVKQIDANKGLGTLEKARQKDAAVKERNAGYGSSIGGGVGAAALGALGFMLGGPLGAMAGGWLGNVAGKWVGEKIGGLFGGSNEKEMIEKYGTPKPIAKPVNTPEVHAAGGAIVPGDSYSGDKTMVAANAGEMIINKEQQSKLFSVITGLPMLGASIKALDTVSNFMKVLPPVQLASTSIKSIGGGGKTDVNLNVSGTIKLDIGNKAVDFDISKLLETPEFKRQLADIMVRTINENSNAGKRNMESERNNMASQYNRNGA